MCESNPTPTLSELLLAAIAGFAWAAIGVVIAAWPDACAQGAPCRVHNYLADGSANVGSGTLIDVTPDGQRGLVLSCAHLFSEGTGRVVVQFANGQTHGARLASIDHDADLAAIEIATPGRQATSVSLQLQPSGSLRACGFGPSGEYRCVDRQVLGYSERPGQQSVRLAGAVRSGDSGGGVVDEQGRLTAVVWGESGGVTYASTGRPLAAFLNRVLGSRRSAAVASAPAASVAACPDGRCPLVRPGVIGGGPAGSLPAAGRGVGAARPLAPSGGCGCAGQLAAIGARLDGLERATPSSGKGSPPPAAWGGTARVLATLATTALGISGPTGWGVIAAASIGGWLIGRRRKRKARAATAAEATAAAEVAFPIERDDREARELLRLSQLEGRDPLQDAVAGRVALDRLDAIAESDADSLHATWADRLRRELRERFNEIAPTKFQVSPR